MRETKGMKPVHLYGDDCSFDSIHLTQPLGIDPLFSSTPPIKAASFKQAFARTEDILLP